MRQSGNGALEVAVLIVEDHAPLRTALYDLIKGSFPKLQVIDAYDGATALAHFGAHSPLFVLMDIHLPELRAWAKYWGCAQQDIRDAVRTSGVMVADVSDWLKINVVALSETRPR